MNHAEVHLLNRCPDPPLAKPEPIPKLEPLAENSWCRSRKLTRPEHVGCFVQHLLPPGLGFRVSSEDRETILYWRYPRIGAGYVPGFVGVFSVNIVLGKDRASTGRVETSKAFDSQTRTHISAVQADTAEIKTRGNLVFKVAANLSGRRAGAPFSSSQSPLSVVQILVNGQDICRAGLVQNMSTAPWPGANDNV